MAAIEALLYDPFLWSPSSVEKLLYAVLDHLQHGRASEMDGGDLVRNIKDRQINEISCSSFKLIEKSELIH